MNDRQKEAIQIALEGHNLLLLGSAGTGKSHVVKEIKKRLESKGKQVQLTCSTGIACHIYADACTVHQFTGISDGRYGPSEILDVLNNNKQYDDVVAKIKKCDVLIVDECSMISCRTFDTINKVCSLRSIGTNKPFGGMQVIFVGDFLQLPPVPNPSYQDDGSHCFMSACFKYTFPHTILLHENMRQCESDLIDTICEVYSGQLSRKGLNYIHSLSRPLEVTSTETDSIKLFSKNELLDDYNRECILQFPGELIELLARDSGSRCDLDKLTVPKVLWLKKGCPVILLRNISGKLFNGLRGVVTDISESGVTVHFSDVDITRRIDRIKFTVYSPRLQRDVAVREQYPLKLAFGLTIHKSQGMTLSRVEIDCRDIFKAGQLGVAMSRVTSSAGLRIINFQEKYVIEPIASVKDFFRNISCTEPLPDLTCCRKQVRTPSPEGEIYVQESSDICCDPEHLEVTEEIPDDDILDDDFDSIIVAIQEAENRATDTEIPPDFQLNLTETKFKKEITEFHRQYNDLVSRIDNDRVSIFVKKLFCKFQEFQNILSVNENDPKPVPEKKITQFYTLAHEYSVSGEYKMNCLILFENEDSFTDVHHSLCYNILEAVRLYVIEEKAKLFKMSERKITPRSVTNACRARIRYVAGYCVAKLRNKYLKLKKSNIFSGSGQYVYESAKCTLSILNVLKEDEMFLLSNSAEPESLTDVCRKQNLKHGLTYVSDNCYLFFLQLTDKTLKFLVNENFIKHGQTMYAACLNEINSDKALFENFTSLVIKGIYGSENEFFHISLKLENVLHNMTLISSQIITVFDELVAKYVLVLFAQFRKDMKSALRIEKTLAHRKQIKISKRNTKPSENNNSDNVKQSSTASNLCTGLLSPVAGPSVSTDNDKETSESCTTVDAQSDYCKECNLKHNNDEWICCDNCNCWFHRRCAGLGNGQRWKKVSQPDVQWHCKYCPPQQSSVKKGVRKRKSKK